VRGKYGEDILRFISQVLQNETAKTRSTCRCGGVGGLIVGDERYMSVEDMDSRFALVVGMCLSGLAHLSGMHLERRRLTVREFCVGYRGQGTVEGISQTGIVEKVVCYQGFICPAFILQNAFFARKEFPRYPTLQSWLIKDLAQEHIDEYSHYIKKGLSSTDASTINDFTNLLVNSVTGTTQGFVRSDVVVLPQIWTHQDRPLDKPFGKFLARGSLTSNPDHWKTLNTLFTNLISLPGIQTAELLEWVNKGLLPGTKKEMRPSAAMASQTAFTILVEIIKHIENAEIRAETWKGEFTAKLLEYVTSSDGTTGRLGGAFGHALTLFDDAKEFDVVWGDICKFVQQLMLTSPVMINEIDVAPMFDKWTQIVHSMVRNFKDEKSEITAIFSSKVRKVAVAAAESIIKTDGFFVDGMGFLATLLQDHTFTSSPLSDDCIAYVKVLITPERAVKLLQSPSSEKYITVLIVLWTHCGREYYPTTWNLVVQQAIPADGKIGVDDPESLFSRLLHALDSPKPGLKRKDFVLDKDMQLNLVREMATTLKASDDEKTENVLRSLINLRGILVSKQTATGLLILAFLHSKNWTKIFSDVFRKEDNLGLALALIDTNFLGSVDFDVNDPLCTFKIKTFLEQIYTYALQDL
jgi:hypothetical protein